MKNLFQFKRVSLLSVLFVAGFACAQSQGEPIQAPDELTLGGFEGCTIAPPKDGCAARIKCSGVGRIYGTSPYAVQDATKEAQVKARAQLAKFYSEKVRARESIASASESSGQSNASGGAKSPTISPNKVVVKNTNTRYLDAGIIGAILGAAAVYLAEKQNWIAVPDKKYKLYAAAAGAFLGMYIVYRKK